MNSLALNFLGFALLAAQTIRVDVQLIQTEVTVTDGEGRMVTDLRPEDFVVEFDGVRQKIEHFALGNEAPVSLGLLIDTSGSMAETLPVALEAASAFILGMRPRDEGFVMSFASKPSTRQDFTQDTRRLFRALVSIDSVGGGTNLFAAVEAAAEKTKKGTYRKRALVVLSDGGETFSGDLQSFSEVVRRSEALIYPVGIESQVRAAGWSSGVLSSMADESGGRRFTINPTRDRKILVQQFNDVFTQLTTELRGQYSIGFYPSSGTRLALGKLRLRAANPAYKLRHR